MNISLIYAADFKPPEFFSKDQAKNIGPTWGSYKSWRHCDTDNVICNDAGKARELCQRAMHAVCNLYLPQKLFVTLDRHPGIKWYQGTFDDAVIDIEDIISMHLVAVHSDLVLCLGFDLSNPDVSLDQKTTHSMKNRLGLIRSCINQNSKTQWVFVDHNESFHSIFHNMANIDRDSLKNVLKLLDPN